MNNPYRLHYAPDNASLIVRLVLEEMRLPYQTILINKRAGELDNAPYRALNPNGLIPVLETPHGPIFETAAILLWLVDTHQRMAPAVDQAERASFLKWLIFASNTLHADLCILFYADKYIDHAHAEDLRTGIRPRLRQHLKLLDDLARPEPDWFSPEQPSVLCYYVACMMRWMALYPARTDRSWYQLPDTPHLQRILTQLELRPATRAAIAAEGLGATPFTSPTYATPSEGSAT